MYFLCADALQYHPSMNAKLTEELTAALRAHGENELEVVDPQTQRTYLLVDAATHRQAMEALRRQQDRDAIARGIAEMQAGEGIPVEQARRLTRERLLAPES
jgi:hypothetical protein